MMNKYDFVLEIFLWTIAWIEERGKYTYFMFGVEERECSMWEMGSGCSLQRALWDVSVVNGTEILSWRKSENSCPGLTASDPLLSINNIHPIDSILITSWRRKGKRKRSLCSLQFAASHQKVEGTRKHVSRNLRWKKHWLLIKGIQDQGFLTKKRKEKWIEAKSGVMERCHRTRRKKKGKSRA